MGLMVILWVICLGVLRPRTLVLARLAAVLIEHISSWIHLSWPDVSQANNLSSLQVQSYNVSLNIILKSCSCNISLAMQRQPYAPIPAHSPPLHHPVPQHVSTVPQLRSPPPPMPQQQQTNSYGNPYASAPPQAGGAFAPGFGGFINETQAQMGFQVAQSAGKAGQEYLEQNVRRINALDWTFR